jgi:membrane peptidoglycan carboxypeptidase
VKPLPCQTALAALPAELTPALQGFKVSGTFSTDLHLGLDLDDLETPVDLGGLVGIEGCKVVEAPDWPNAERLGVTFEQTVETEPGKWLTFFAGPENPDWVPYSDISPHLVNSIMTTEDSGFFKHKGFIPSEFRSALQQNLQRGYFRLGASSITMQMVKNVLLSREKTLSRKLQELFLTWYMEHSLTKERILEIYFNVIEFGPGIYGIGRAAHHYFGKPAKELLPQEAAWFSSILPNPKRRYEHFCRAAEALDGKWDNYVKRILRKVHERGRMSDEDYAKAIAGPLTFDRAEAPPEKDCLALVKRFTTPPGAAPPTAPTAAAH